MGLRCLLNVQMDTFDDNTETMDQILLCLNHLNLQMEAVVLLQHAEPQQAASRVRTILKAMTNGAPFPVDHRCFAFISRIELLEMLTAHYARQELGSHDIMLSFLQQIIASPHLTSIRCVSDDTQMEMRKSLLHRFYVHVLQSQFGE